MLVVSIAAWALFPKPILLCDKGSSLVELELLRGLQQDRKIHVRNERGSGGTTRSGRARVTSRALAPSWPLLPAVARAPTASANSTWSPRPSRSSGPWAPGDSGNGDVVIEGTGNWRRSNVVKQE